MTINPTEISDIIKDKLKDFKLETKAHNEGTVVTLTDGIARIYGITDALQGEMLEFPNKTFGIALNLERDSVGAVILGDYKHISEGDPVKCTGRILEVPIGDSLLGRVVNSLGEPIDNNGPIKYRIKTPIPILPTIEIRYTMMVLYFWKRKYGIDKRHSVTGNIDNRKTLRTSLSILTT